MGFLNTNSMPRLVEKLADGDNIKITGNSKGNRVGTVIKKIVEKADEVTKAVEQEIVNDNYSFKVGIGDVDVSTDVQDGFGEVGIKGVTYQNLVNGSTLDNPHSTLIKPNTTYTIIAKKISGESQFNVVCDDSSHSLFIPSNAEANKIYIVKRDTYSNDTKMYFMNVNSEVAPTVIEDLIILEGDHTNNPNLPSYFEGIVGVGDKSKNLFNPNNLKQTVLDLGKKGEGCIEKNSNTRCSIRSIPCKPNTKYTLKSDKAIYTSLGSIDSDNIALGDSGWRIAKNGFTYTTPSNAVELAMNFKNESSTNITPDDVRAINIQLQEGENADTYQPYGTHKIEILSRTKNIWNGIWLDEYVSTTNGTLSSSNTAFRSDYIAVDKDSDYYISIENPNEKILVAYYDINKNYLGRTGGTSWKSITLKRTNGSFPTGTTAVMPPTIKYIVFSSYSYSTIENRDNSKFNMKIQIEQGGSPTSYVSPQQDKTQILLDEPLMQLPNGVCDEITRDGKLIRRVGKGVLNGSENWYSYNALGNVLRLGSSKFRSSMKKVKGVSANLVCDNFPAIANANIDCENICHNVNPDIILGINTSKLETNDATGFRKWLQANPTTVYYELAEPIVTELPAPYLRIFKDGHLTFNTLVAPESTHVVQLNKSAQIERSIREVQGLDGRVEKLESFYDDMILETSHKLNLLNYDFDYMRNTEDEI